MMPASTSATVAKQNSPAEIQIHPCFQFRIILHLRGRLGNRPVVKEASYGAAVAKLNAAPTEDSAIVPQKRPSKGPHEQRWSRGRPQSLDVFTMLACFALALIVTISSLWRR